MAAMTPAEKSSGVVGALAVVMCPFIEMTTQSVKVPPMSIPMLNRSLLDMSPSVFDAMVVGRARAAAGPSPLEGGLQSRARSATIFR